MLMTTFYILYNIVAISTNIVGYKFKLYTFAIVGSMFKLIVI